MKRRILPILLSLALTASALPAALAAPTATVDDMAQVLSALDIMTGNENGDLMLSRSVTRAEFTKLVVAASPLGENVGASTTVSPYPDVPYTLWCAPYVEAAVAAGYVQGNLYGYFEPDREITLKEGVTMAVRLLGYTDGDFSGAWPSGQMTLYHNLDLDEGISLGPDATMTRLDAMHLFYNLLTARTKAGQVYLNLLGHGLTPTGEIDRVALINSAMEGPVVMEEGWQSKVNFDVSNAAVYRGGDRSSLTALRSGDVIYWSKPMRTLWAYSNKITGLCQAVSPNASNPSAVTVAGKTYTIETAGAAYSLSNLGPFKTGDTVTLLLGRDGGVAAVTSAASSLSGSLYGVITRIADQPYTDAGGSSYTAKTVTLTATDGLSYSYPVDATSTLRVGNLVQVSALSGDATQVKRLSPSSVSGRVSADGGKLGGVPFAPDAEILDVTDGGGWIRIYPSRLSGASLNSSDVKFCLKNAAGEIEKLILDDFTGDIHSYGVVTSSSKVEYGMVNSGVYQYDVGGVPYVYQSSTVFNLSSGPAKLVGPLQAPETITPLTSVRLVSADALTALSRDNTAFPVSDALAVYVLEDTHYRLSSLDRVQSGYTLTGWYDESAVNGGRIRIIIAQAE